MTVRSSTLHERMAGNDRDRAVAFEAAEAALRDAEQDILANITHGERLRRGLHRRPVHSGDGRDAQLECGGLD